jgi:NAD(P)-dependent dehydrogenase (short-subunit alcohol dehydrogenase family)
MIVIGGTTREGGMGRLSGKVAFITGGEGSVGMATARRLAAADARVVLVGVDEEGLGAGVAELGRDVASHVVADVTEADQVAAAVRATMDRHGGIDVVFSNAGISGVIAPLTDYPDDVFDRVLAVHVRGTFLVCKHAVPVVRAGGSVIITSSVVGLTSAAGICAYATAKHAQIGLMRTLAHETAARGIRVNTIHPGPIENDFQHAIEMEITGATKEEAAKAFDRLIPFGRHADPDEVARVVLFLAGEESSFITGATIPIDGGMSI